MKEGLLWFDNDPQRKLNDKINQAARRYQTKFGKKPTTCYLNVSDFEGETETGEGIRLMPTRDVLRHHFWIGIDNSMLKAA
jgi:hypothetical protein